MKFSYGKFSSQFKWRQPYIGQEVNPSAPSASSFQEGAKETYYLNFIATRTHTALFLKSVRNDGRGHYAGSRARLNTSNLGILETTPASSMRLDEIVVLNNANLASIKANTGFGEDTGNNSANQNSTLGTGDSYAEVLDPNDLVARTSIRTAFDRSALKRVVFNYSYRLCPGTSNSFASTTAPPDMPTAYTATSRLGKLTLESVSTYGANSVKLIPDFKFDYGYNPSYDPYRFDAFGMYSRNGTSATYSHSTTDDVAQASQDGAAWSLTKLTSPLGAVTEFTYERDQYSSVSEYANEQYSFQDQGTSAPTGVLQNDGSFDLTSIFKVGDVVQGAGYSLESYHIYGSPTQYSQNPPEDYTTQCGTSFSSAYTITAVTATTITLDSTPPAPLPFQ